jgi:hypothetical protein
MGLPYFAAVESLVNRLDHDRQGKQHQHEQGSRESYRTPHQDSNHARCGHWGLRFRTEQHYSGLLRPRRDLVAHAREPGAV